MRARNVSHPKKKLRILVEAAKQTDLTRESGIRDVVILILWN